MYACLLLLQAKAEELTDALEEYGYVQGESPA
jgi:hypothetical protein